MFEYQDLCKVHEALQDVSQDVYNKVFPILVKECHMPSILYSADSEEVHETVRNKTAKTLDVAAGYSIRSYTKPFLFRVERYYHYKMVIHSLRERDRHGHWNEELATPKKATIAYVQVQYVEDPIHLGSWHVFVHDVNMKKRHEAKTHTALELPELIQGLLGDFDTQCRSLDGIEPRIPIKIREKTPVGCWHVRYDCCDIDGLDRRGRLYC